MGRRLLTEAEAADYLNVRQRLLNEWRHNDRYTTQARGPAWKKLGRLIRYDQADLDAWLDKEK